jgi:hypothetical protein
MSSEATESTWILDDYIYSNRFAGPTRAAMCAHVRMGGTIELSKIYEHGHLNNERLLEIVNKATQTLPFIHDRELNEKIDALIASKPDSIDAWKWLYEPIVCAAVLAHIYAGGSLDPIDEKCGMPINQLVAYVLQHGVGLPNPAILAERCEAFVLHTIGYSNAHDLSKPPMFTLKELERRRILFDEAIQEIMLK